MQTLASSPDPVAGYEVRIEERAARPAAVVRADVTFDEITKEGTVALTLHTGRYDEVAAAYAAVMEWLAAHDLEVAGDPYETYLDGPDATQPRTEVCVPCAPRVTSGR